MHEFLTTDIETIKYRSALFTELLADNALVSMFKEMLPNIEAFYEAQTIKDDRIDTESNLFVIREIELYIECMGKLHKTMRSMRLNSDSLRGFRGAVSEIVESANFISLKESVNAMSFKINGIKSVTFGANLNSQFQPIEAGILSINDKPFSSGSIIDKFLRLGNVPETEVCISPLIPLQRGMSQMETVALNGAFINALSGLLNKSVRTWRPVVAKYLLGARGFLTDLLDEIRFVLAAVKCLDNLKKKGFSLCNAIIANKGDEVLAGLYNPLTALKMNSSENMVLNDHRFDVNGMIYVLTGPNAGGKSVFLHGVGIAYAFFHLGLPIPANVARLYPADGLFTHFLKKDENLLGHSRFTEECERVGLIAKQLTNNSLFFFDESLSGTSGTEAEYIAGEVLTAFGIKGARGIFATHLHGLSTKTAEYSENQRNISKIDNLCADSEMTKNDERSFTILRKPSDGLSHARDIAKKYGLSIDEICP